MSAYRAGIDLTIRTIERRARYYRNQVVAVALMIILDVGWALTARSALPLLASLLLVPVCGLFLGADYGALNQWRSALFEAWGRRELDFTAFRDAIRANPALPPETAAAMLAELPIVGNLAVEHRISTPTRRAIAAVWLARHGSHADAIGLKTAAAGIAGVGIIAASVLHRWEPLAAVAGFVLVPIGGRYLKRHRRSVMEREIAAWRARAEFSEADYANCVGA